MHSIQCMADHYSQLHHLLGAENESQEVCCTRGWIFWLELDCKYAYLLFSRYAIKAHSKSPASLLIWDGHSTAKKHLSGPGVFSTNTMVQAHNGRSAFVFKQAMWFGSTALSPADAGTTTQSTSIQCSHTWILGRRSKQTMGMLVFHQSPKQNCRNCQERNNQQVTEKLEIMLAVMFRAVVAVICQLAIVSGKKLRKEPVL